MRHDLIGPRRLRPAGTFNNPIFTMTGERSDRVLKGLVMPGVTEGAIDGVLPGARAARPPQPALIVKAYIESKDYPDKPHHRAGYDLVLHEHFKSGNPKRSAQHLRSAKKLIREGAHVPSIRRHVAVLEQGLRGSKRSWASHSAAKRALNHPLISKAIEGQQSVTAPISAHDPMYAHGQFTHQHGMHIDAAKHHIQADHFSRQKGGELRSQYHQKEFKKLQGQGANPTREHYKQAMGELHPTFKEVMRSLDALGKAAEMQREPSSVTRPPSPIVKEAGETFAAKEQRRSRPTVKIPRETMQQVVSQKLKSLAKAAEKVQQGGGRAAGPHDRRGLGPRDGRGGRCEGREIEKGRRYSPALAAGAPSFAPKTEAEVPDKHRAMAKDHREQVRRLQSHHEGRKLHPGYKLAQEHKRLAEAHEDAATKPFDRDRSLRLLTQSHQAYDKNNRYNKQYSAGHATIG